MKCPKCGGKSKVCQTHKLVETKMEKRSRGGGYDSPLEIVDVPVEYDVVRRKQKCLTCGTYFWTKETFECYTEQEVRNTYMEELQGKVDTLIDSLGDDTVYCYAPEKTKLKFNISVSRKDK